MRNHSARGSQRPRANITLADDVQEAAQAADFAAFHAQRPWLAAALGHLIDDLQINGAAVVSMGMLLEVARYQSLRGDLPPGLADEDLGRYRSEYVDQLTLESPRRGVVQR